MWPFPRKKKEEFKRSAYAHDTVRQSDDFSQSLVNPLNPLSPLSPFNPLSPISVWDSTPAASCDTSSSFDSGSSSSFDSGGGSCGGGDF